MIHLNSVLWGLSEPWSSREHEACFASKKRCELAAKWKCLRSQGSRASVKTVTQKKVGGKKEVLAFAAFFLVLLVSSVFYDCQIFLLHFISFCVCLCWSLLDSCLPVWLQGSFVLFRLKKIFFISSWIPCPSIVVSCHILIAFWWLPVPQQGEQSHNIVDSGQLFHGGAFKIVQT